ncbi:MULTISPECIES: DUF2178 domain-containing protein [Halobacterium]|uniref:DUF2178 family protein n=4 Tax=Halobacterium salinarum TaxID=2242 RepID=Q9HRZ7_HALSA|nr:MULTISPECIES: DUF2178 domain-containing protein [Halobacterium]AAG19011.1 hypothetical protein VNG_0472H [Halobacterium salinarum NRC-1]MBB6089844.1 hypothetical protein [Halobacterium salinarum]MCF2164065.1 DUF2178 domain-containing protein [Halobacterium salinarum]MCF2167859.1 DUF2178 domain-containing protein [Halobacterium salinarum]MCF2239322.1 DUF2178 domain-containing protein [Halobacterium salinarum]
MSDRGSTGTGRLAKVRRYRRLMYACIGVGVGGFIVAAEFDYPLAGLVVYWAGILGSLAVWKGTSVTLYDERDLDLERRASLLTLQIAGVVGLLAMTTHVVVDQMPSVDVPEEFVGGFLTISALFIVYGVVYTAIRYRR